MRPWGSAEPTYAISRGAQLHEMRETVGILEVKIQKLEQLVRLKDSKIATLQAKLTQAGI